MNIRTIRTIRTWPIEDFGQHIPNILRATSIIFLIMTILCWANTLGITWPELRFDNLSDEGKVVAVFSCVLRPIVALGMWGLHRWAWAVWGFAVLCDYLMYVVLSSEFGSNTLLLCYHFIFLVVFCMYKLHEICVHKFKKSDT